MTTDRNELSMSSSSVDWQSHLSLAPFDLPIQFNECSIAHRRHSTVLSRENAHSEREDGSDRGRQWRWCLGTFLCTGLVGQSHPSHLGKSQQEITNLSESHMAPPQRTVFHSTTLVPPPSTPNRSSSSTTLTKVKLHLTTHLNIKPSMSSICGWRVNLHWSIQVILSLPLITDSWQ